MKKVIISLLLIFGLFNVSIAFDWDSIAENININKIVEYINYMDADKLGHFYANAYIASEMKQNNSNEIAVGVPALISIGKEIYDWRWGTGWSWGDIYADVLGICIGIIQ